MTVESKENTGQGTMDKGRKCKEIKVNGSHGAARGEAERSQRPAGEGPGVPG